MTEAVLYTTPTLDNKPFTVIFRHVSCCQKTLEHRFSHMEIYIWALRYVVTFNQLVTTVSNHHEL